MLPATSPIVRLQHLTKKTLQGCLSMAWHLYRIATFRPAFASMADKALTVASFGFVFWLASVGRFAVFGHNGVHYATVNCALYFFWLCLLLERKQRSSSLLCAAMGLSALIDFAAAGLYLAGQWPMAGSTYKTSSVAFLVELLAVAVLRWQFFKAPADAQMTGYRRKA